MKNNLKLEYLDSIELANLIKNKIITPTYVIDYFKDRILKRNKSINALTYTNFDYAYKKAIELENKINNNEEVGLLAGVPFALKDFLDSKKGWSNSHGGVKCLERIDNYDSEFTKAIEELGGICIGKTNAPAYGFRGTCDNYLYGPTSTPFNTKYNSGGSSGGSASAVADGLVMVAEGSDGGGSIRIPAALNNLFGFKPSVGSVPQVNRPDAFSATHPYCFNGLLSKSVLETALIFDKMCRYDPLDPNSHLRNVSNFPLEIKKDIKGIKIAYTDDFGIFEVKENIKKKVYKEALKFEKLGASITKVNFNFKRSAFEYADIWCKGISIDTAIENQLNNNELIKKYKDQFPKEFIKYNNIVQKSKLLDLYELNLARSEILDEFERVFKDYDLIISPVLSILKIKNAKNNNTLGPKKINGVKINPLIGYCLTFLTNFSGHPSASIPAGLINKMPVGMQIIGKKHDDLTILRACYNYEQINPWKKYYSIPFNRKINI